MPKRSLTFVCQNCGAAFSRWQGKCEACAEWNTLSEEGAERLLQQGLTSEQIQRIHGPIGLNIGATSPEEIALAIMAQIVAIRHGRQ